MAMTDEHLAKIRAAFDRFHDTVDGDVNWGPTRLARWRADRPDGRSTPAAGGGHRLDMELGGCLLDRDVLAKARDQWREDCGVWQRRVQELTDRLRKYGPLQDE